MERVRLVDWLKSERDQHVGGGLYYNSQILFAYNSNHMEGSTLSPEQTAQLFNTGALLPDNINDEIRADDVAETTNHFNAFNWVLDHVDDPVNKSLVCSLHGILKRGTSQEFDANRNVGGYKIVPNVISQLEGIHTVLPADVPLAMKQVFSLYSQLEDDPFAIAKAHVFCQVVIGQCGVSFPSEKAVGFSPVRNWPVIARVLLFHCIRA